MTCGVVDATSYAPVPTGVALVNVAGSATVDQTCLGSMNVLPAMKNRSENSGRLNDSVTVCASGVVTPVSGRLYWFSALLEISSPNVKATSALVNGWPSDHWTPERRVNVSEVPSGDHL